MMLGWVCCWAKAAAVVESRARPTSRTISRRVFACMDVKLAADRRWLDGAVRHGIGGEAAYGWPGSAVVASERYFGAEAMTVPSRKSFNRKQVVRLVEQLPDQEIPAAGRYLEQLVESADPFFKHLMEAPEEDEALSEEGQRLLDEGYEDLDAGRTHTLEEVIVDGLSASA